MILDAEPKKIQKTLELHRNAAGRAEVHRTEKT
jgi:hypothetical protein